MTIGDVHKTAEEHRTRTLDTQLEQSLAGANPDPADQWETDIEAQRRSS